MTDEQVTTVGDVDAGSRLFDVDTVAPRQTIGLNDRFVVPPFTVLDTRQGYWQDRKREWLSLGIRSEVGRGDKLAYNIGEWDEYRDREARRLLDGSIDTSRRAADERSNVNNKQPLPDYATNGMSKVAPGTSIFDPVLCEIAYRWHTPDTGAHVLDPFAGGSVRGIIAAILGRTYTGVELRPEQVAANETQVPEVLHASHPDAPAPTWIVGDSTDVDVLAGDRMYDMIFSCPPYADLEVYSDDPRDLSNMDYPDFLDSYRTIIARSCELLRDDRFAVWVIGEARHKRDGHSHGIVADTVKAFQDAGLRLYNEAVLVNMVGTLALRVTKQFRASRKMGRAHQHVFVFVKGDPRAATRWAEGGDVDGDA